MLATGARHGRNRYWDWTWDEMSQFDIPAVLTYIKEEHGVTQVRHLHVSHLHFFV